MVIPATSTQCPYPLMALSLLREAKMASLCSGISTRASTSTLSKQAISSTLLSSRPTDTGYAQPQRPVSKSLTLSPSMSRLLHIGQSLTSSGRLWMSSSPTLSTLALTRASRSVCPSPGLQMARPFSAVSLTTWCASGPFHRRGYIGCMWRGSRFILLSFLFVFFYMQTQNKPLWFPGLHCT